MLQDKKEGKSFGPHERDLIVAYLSYALDDVRALSEMGSQYLQMTIATITEDASPNVTLGTPRTQ
jgi:hypothetical protein